MIAKIIATFLSVLLIAFAVGIIFWIIFIWDSPNLFVGTVMGVFSAILISIGIRVIVSGE